MTFRTTKVQFRCFWTDLNNFIFFDLEIRWRFQILYCTSLQMIHWTTKVLILIRCKINFNIIWYKKYLQLIYTCQYSSDLLISWTSFLWMLSFLFHVTFRKISNSIFNSRKLVCPSILSMTILGHDCRMITNTVR